MSFSVHVVPALSDNYSYLLVDDATQEAAAVDPVEADKVLQRAKDLGVTVTHILTTHSHWDHAGGNADFLSKVPEAIVIAGKGDGVDTATRECGHGDEIRVGSLVVSVLSTPGHTPGHVCYFVPAGTHCAPAVFTGDMLFVGGCGNFNSGTPAQFWAAFGQVLPGLPDETRVYCGHEYTAKNLAFALTVEPENAALRSLVSRVEELRAEGKPTVPSTIASEKATNVFMRVREAAPAAFVGTSDPVEAIAAMRRAKDEWGRRR